MAAAQSNLPPRGYVFRISHETYDQYSCALLQTNGAFHLEFARGDDIRVFEGTTSEPDVHRIQRILDDPELVRLSQRDIEEPIVRGRTEKLQLTIYRQDGWQDLFFQSVESEEAFRQSVAELIGWLDELHKLPHTEFSEDEGKQNCLPPRPITLKKRDASPPQHQTDSGMNLGTRSILKAPPLATLPMSSAAKPLLRVHSVSVSSSDARQFCTLIADNGAYRFESHYQKTGKPVSSVINNGELSSQQVAQLRAILNAPALEKVQHHEPRGSAPVPVLGNILNLSIARPTGVQNLILSSSYGRQFETFYGGDADIRSARELTKFLKEYVEANGNKPLDRSARNDCTALP